MVVHKSKVIADVTIFPVGVGPSVGDYVRAAFKAMRTVKGLKLRPNAMSTVVEADGLPDVLLATRRAHRTLLKMGAQRIYMMLRIDHRLDKPETARYKLNRIEGRIR